MSDERTSEPNLSVRQAMQDALTHLVRTAPPGALTGEAIYEAMFEAANAALRRRDGPNAVLLERQKFVYGVSVEEFLAKRRALKEQQASQLKR